VALFGIGRRQLVALLVRRTVVGTVIAMRDAMRSPRLFVAAVVLAITATASADPLTLSDRAPRKHVATAYALVGAGLVLSTTAMIVGGELHGRAEEDLELAGVGGLIVAPSLGHMYASDWVSGGLLLRIAGSGVVVGGLYSLVSTELDPGEWHTHPTPNGPTAVSNDGSFGGGLLLVGLGLAGIVGGAVLDLTTTGSAVDDWNHEHHLMLAPTALPTPTGMAGGFALTGQF
jgi:hypothetical protein